MIIFNVVDKIISKLWSLIQYLSENFLNHVYFT